MITYFGAKESSTNGAYGLGGINASGQVGTPHDTFTRGFKLVGTSRSQSYREIGLSLTSTPQRKFTPSRLGMTDLIWS